MERSFDSLFQVKKPIIGMIHLAGNSRKDKLERALDEMLIFEGEGVDGVIIENYAAESCP